MMLDRRLTLVLWLLGPTFHLLAFYSAIQKQIADAQTSTNGPDLEFLGNISAIASGFAALISVFLIIAFQRKATPVQVKRFFWLQILGFALGSYFELVRYGDDIHISAYAVLGLLIAWLVVSVLIANRQIAASK